VSYIAFNVEIREEMCSPSRTCIVSVNFFFLYELSLMGDKHSQYQVYKNPFIGLTICFTCDCGESGRAILVAGPNYLFFCVCKLCSDIVYTRKHLNR